MLEDGTNMPLRKENLEVEFLWEDMGKRVIDLDSDEEQNDTAGLRFGQVTPRKIEAARFFAAISLLYSCDVD